MRRRMRLIGTTSSSSSNSPLACAVGCSPSFRRGRRGRRQFGRRLFGLLLFDVTQHIRRLERRAAGCDVGGGKAVLAKCAAGGGVRGTSAACGSGELVSAKAAQSRLPVAWFRLMPLFSQLPIRRPLPHQQYPPPCRRPMFSQSMPRRSR